VTTLRVVAVGLRLRPSRVTTREVFAASLRRTLDEHVVAHPTAPTLVALPEHTGLLAMLAGDRGAAARDALERGETTIASLTALAVAYGEQLGHYAAAFPTVDSAGQLLHLALTDTLVHVLVDTVAELARDRQLWLTVGAALPSWQRVTGAAAAALSPPDGRPHAYAATAPEVRNRNLVFAPDGELVAVQDKAYLVPLERDREAGLGLDALPLDRLATAGLPFGRLASVISKDAWMVDVNDRLDQLGAQVLVQPEAFDRWHEVDRGVDAAGELINDLWPPDKFQRGGWWMVQQRPAYRVNVTPVLLGRLGDLAFDGQPAVAVPAPAGEPGLGLLGQPPDEGWAAVGPWWRQPTQQAAALADQRRRQELAATPPAPGPAVDVGAGADEVARADEVASADVVAVADVRLPARREASADQPRLPGLRPSSAVGDPGSLLVPHLAVHAGTPVLAGVAGDGRGRQQVVTSRWSEGRWGPLQPVAPAPEGTPPPFDRQWRPRLCAAGGGHLVCTYLGFPAESWDVFLTVSTADGWLPPVRVDDADREVGVLRERGHDTPIVLADGEGLVVVWSDLRWPWVLPQLRTARSSDGGRGWSSSRRIDGGPTTGSPDPLALRSAAETGGQAAPTAVAVEGGAVVAWQERLPGEGPRTWISHRVGGCWAAPARPPADHEGPRWRPCLAAAGATVWLVEEVATSDGGVRLDLRVSADGGRSFGPPTALDPARPVGVSQRRAVAVAVDDGLVVVFEDDRAGHARIVTVAVDGHQRAGPVWRVDDAPVGADARNPAAVRWGEQLVVAWQDTRGDLERVHSTELRLPTAADGARPWRCA
jgi:predicted amidohydrolase